MNSYTSVSVKIKIQNRHFNKLISFCKRCNRFRNRTVPTRFQNQAWKKIIKNSLSSEDFSDSGKVGKNTYTGGVESTRWQYHGNELEVNQQDHEGYDNGLKKIGVGAGLVQYLICQLPGMRRKKLPEIVSRTAKEVFVPLTVGGGRRNIDDVTELLRAGADKVAINTAAVKNPKLINEVSRQFGSHCMVLSIEAKKQSENSWEVYTDSGREKTGIDVLDWVKEGVLQGAGEILLTSIDREGTKKGFDLNLIKLITDSVNIPVIASGGMGSFQHLEDAVKLSGADGIAMADILHYERSSIPAIRKSALESNINVRHYEF